MQRPMKPDIRSLQLCVMKSACQRSLSSTLGFYSPIAKHNLDALTRLLVYAHDGSASPRRAEAYVDSLDVYVRP